MTILHYTIGLPPIRQGGSVQYACDLMLEQARRYKVIALVCGDTLFRSKKCRIKHKGRLGCINVFSLTNPLTPTLIYGTSDPGTQLRDITMDYDGIRQFIECNDICIMHLHTLMGIHRNMVAYIKSLGVRIVYTTHDFHGVCPHYNLINYKGELCGGGDGRACCMCNLHEPSDTFLRLVNSSLYHFFKHIGVDSLVKTVKSAISGKTASGSMPKYAVDEKRISEFERLLDYYRDFFALIDKFHFNSRQTAEIFRRFIPAATGGIFPVVTSRIKDCRKPLSLNENEIVFGFIGSEKEYKGFPMLRKVLIDLYRQGQRNFRLLVYSGGREHLDPDCPHIEYRSPYDYDRLHDILYHLDGTIVPSKWYETFSLVTLESLSHGRPAIVSSHVGAKDIVAAYSPDFVFSNEKELELLIGKILSSPNILHECNRKILDGEWKFFMERHTAEIVDFYSANH